MSDELPAAFVGLWVRVELSLDGGPPHEDQVVWWAQASSAFADLRVPCAAGAGADAFAGRTTWDRPALTWHREVDLHGHPVHDRGEVAWDGDDLLESGTFAFGGGTPTPYVERWRRVPGSELAARTVARRALGVLVAVGEHAVAVVGDGTRGEVRAGTWRRGPGGWAPEAVWPPSSRPPVPLTLIGAPLGSTACGEDGAPWAVVEHAPG